MSPPERLRVRSYAKINLGLRILGERPDHYHEIETVFQLIDLSDTIEFLISPSPNIELSTNYSFLSNESNLIVKAAKLLRATYQVSQGIRVKLTKNIPVGGGLGGGSSNAAITLWSLQKIWDLPCTPNELQLLGGQLGSDIPFFFTGGCAHATGKGEVLTEFPFSGNYWVVTITPNFGISTAWAYQNLTLTKFDKNLKLISLISENLPALDQWSSVFTNDFEPTVLERYPEIGQNKEDLKKLKADFCSLSGSGGTVYGVFETEEKAQGAFSTLVKKKNCNVHICRPIFLPGLDGLIIDQS